MKVIDELRGAVEALAIGLYYEGKGERIPSLEEARAVVKPHLARPWRDFLALLLGTSTLSMMTLLNELQRLGLAAVTLDQLSVILETLPRQVIHDGEIEMDAETEDDDDDELPFIQ